MTPAQRAAEKIAPYAPSMSASDIAAIIDAEFAPARELAEVLRKMIRDFACKVDDNDAATMQAAVDALANWEASHA